MNVSDLAACAVGSGNDLSINDDSTANTGSQCYHDTALMSGCCAFPHLPQSCHIGIIAALAHKTGQFGQFSGDLFIAPAEICGMRHNALCIDRPRNSDTDTSH